MIFFAGSLGESLKPPINPIGFLKWLFWFFVILWFIWFFTGGPERYEARQGPFLKPPAPLDTGESYGPDGLPIIAPPVPRYNDSWVRIDRGLYAFEAPAPWRPQTPRYAKGCLEDSVRNDTMTARHAGGEIAIRETACYDIDEDEAKQRYVRRSGYYIIAYWGDEATDAERAETLEAYDRAIRTFSARR